MVSTIRALNGQTNSDIVMNGSSTGFYVVILAGPTRIGKTSRADSLAERVDYKYGPKGKLRPEGVTKEGDGTRPDSIHIKNQKDLEKLRSQGVVLAEYNHEGTTYAILREYYDRKRGILCTSVPENNHVMYVALNHDGAMKTREALLEYNPIPILLYTSLDVLRQRLEASNMPEQEKSIRLQTYARDFAQFKVNTQDYLFLRHVKDPFMPDEFYLDDSARQKAKTEIARGAQGIVDLIDRFNKIFRPPMSYLDVHSAFINEQVKGLFNTDLDNLGRMLGEGARVILDVNQQVNGFLGSNNYLSSTQQEELTNVQAVRLINANGRYTLFLKGLEDPWKHNNGHKSLEDLLLEFVVQKIGEPTQKISVKEQPLNTISTYGLVKVLSDVHIKQIATFSLGHTDLVDQTHPSLTLAFLYPQNGDVDLSRVPIIGLDSTEVQDLENRVIQ